MSTRTGIEAACLLLLVALASFLWCSAPTPSPKSETPTKEQVEKARVWGVFCESLAHYARVQAGLRDDGVLQKRVFPSLQPADEKLSAILDEVRDMVYDWEDVSPEVLAIEIEIMCLEHWEKNK